MEYLRVGQQKGNPWATMLLADRHLKGLGVKKSTATARGGPPATGSRGATAGARGAGFAAAGVLPPGV